MTTASPSNRQEMMFLGKECHHPACHLHDFLPFSCPACHLSYCQPHFLPSAHSCTAPLPASMVDRIAPRCPMCDTIVPYVSSSQQDPNIAVERHILSGTCSGFEGGEERKEAELRRKRENGEICWRRGCGKNLVVKMHCASCNHDFCPTHRHINSHTCTPSATPSSSRSATPQPPVTQPAGKAAISRLLPPSMQPPIASSSKPQPSASPKIPSQSSNTPPTPITTASDPALKQLDARAAAAAAALKRAGQDVKVPFVKSKTEKRTQDELNSTIQALKARHEKGLLSKTEQVRYAELLAEREGARKGRSSIKAGAGAGGKSKDGCVIS